MIKDKGNVSAPQDKQKLIYSLITDLEQSGCVESKFIGIERRPSEIYAIYDRLLKIAPDSLWWNLTFSKSGVMRYYAFETLLMRDDPRLPVVRRRLEKDTSHICCHRADFDLSGTVGSLVRRTSYAGAKKR